MHQFVKSMQQEDNQIRSLIDSNTVKRLVQIIQNYNGVACSIILNTASMVIGELFSCVHIQPQI